MFFNLALQYNLRFFFLNFFHSKDNYKTLKYLLIREAMCDLLEKFMTTYNSAGSEKTVCVCDGVFEPVLFAYLLTLPSTIKKQYKNEWEGKYLNTESVFSY